VERAQPDDVTGLLQAWSAGDPNALEQLVPLIYGELHHQAQRRMAGEAPGHTLQTTALVNEVYLKLVGIREIDWKGRAHFFAVCAQMMRRILTDFARARHYQKRGGGAEHLALDTVLLIWHDPPSDVIALDDALKALAQVDERKSKVVELRFFGGLSVQETAAVLKVSCETVLRDWRLAKTWLMRALREGESGESRAMATN
jgi:RNA polymerase sigma-70 factor (ECF subfamily)